MLLGFALTALAATAWAADSGPLTYAGQEARAIKALSDREIGDLLAGSGMGYAKAAELNGYPGPRHVIDLAVALDLTPDQKAAAERLFQDMKQHATALGERLVAVEAELEALFAAGAAEPERVAALTARSASIEGELRAVHLAAHVALRPVLTAHQRLRYDRLRGYGGGEGHVGHGH
ncbi:MAG TPA: periplasmic heavy metal sensor [Alphaproteobacteria bacterium]|nr:periplasmic heavy metal sensor [Alphaproteobacteria bacterium]